MRDKNGRFKKGSRSYPDTEFKKGHHWCKEKPYWNKEWLIMEYVTNMRTSRDISEQFGVTENAICFWLKKHDIPTRDMITIRKNKYWGTCGKETGMYGRNGKLNPNWKGGISPERAGFYSSREWAIACSFVWNRDDATCQRCKQLKEVMHIHHIVSFAVKKLRSDVNNLVLLCIDCHHFIHSKRNVEGEFIENI